MIQLGSKLAHYEVVSALGKGGMGEVWRARDTKLGREVAIKTLPPDFAEDADRLARFEREAKLLASLNHPNIAAIYGLEEHEGSRFLVLEFVDGETLADRLRRGPIPVEESLKLALQLAGALEAAHEKGVIHRDLKPANVKVTPEGKVKVLDFGLAKAFQVETADASLSQSPTLSMAATQQGMILGTAAYMSPEQARGHGVDQRADVWAFGCVLYEMFTGREVFPGNDVTDILAAVIRAEPDLEALPSDTHWRIREIIDCCLQKDAQNRTHAIADVRIGLKNAPNVTDHWIESTPTRTPIAVPVGTSAALLVIAALGAWGWLRPTTEANLPVRWASIELPASAPMTFLGSSWHTLRSFDVSQDGRLIAYAAEETDGGNRLYVRSLDDPDVRVLEGTDGAYLPFFSPDGRWIGFFSDGQLKKVDVETGTVISLADVVEPYGAVWRSEDEILVSDISSLVLYSATSGLREETPAQCAGTVRSCWLPDPLPDSEWVLGVIVKSGV